MVAHPEDGLMMALVVDTDKKWPISEELIVDDVELYFGAETF